MPGLEIHPLSDLRDEAARLLGERYARQRAAEPLLPEVDDFAPHVADAAGLVATRAGRASPTSRARSTETRRGRASPTTRRRRRRRSATSTRFSRFWPRRGFRPRYVRLYRAVP